MLLQRSDEAKHYCSRDRQGLAASLQWLYNTELFRDTVIQVGSKQENQIRVHGVVLAACSEPFKAMLSGAFSEARNKTIYIPNHSMEVVEHMIGFIYTGEIVLNDANVVSLFAIADQYSVEELKVLCESHVSKRISMDTVATLLTTASQHSADKLYSECMEFICSNADDLFASPEYLISLPESVLVAVLQMQFHVNEETVFNFIVEWGRTRDMPLYTALSKVIRHIRLCSLRGEFITSTVLPLQVLPEEMYLDTDLPHKPWKIPRFQLYLTMADFKNEQTYGAYLMRMLKPGMLVIAVNSYESVHTGDVGEFIQYNSGIPPCQVAWRGYGAPYWLFWKDIEICSNT